MLTNVTNALRVANRNVVLRHPNALPCDLWRRKVARTAEAGAGISADSLTLGGIGTLDADDEAEFEYENLGPGKMLFTGTRQPMPMSDRRDVSDQDMTVPVEVQAEPETAGAWEGKDGDLLTCYPGGGIVITFEVTSVIGQVHIPPYVMRLEVQAQGDLVYIPEIAAAVAARTP